jgi:hypothetical protein
MDPALASELHDVLTAFYIPEGMIIQGGGGLSKIKQALSKAFVDKQWKTNKPLVRTAVSEPKLAHSKRFEDQTIGLDILWNNKDPSFDTHLDYYEEQYQKGELSLCVMITRGESLQDELLYVYERFLDSLNPFNVDHLCQHINISKKKTAEFEKIFNSPILIKEEKVKKIAKDLWTSKFGTATSHMDKLLPRIEQRGANRCPLVIIGIGSDRLKK